MRTSGTAIHLRVSPTYSSRFEAVRKDKPVSDEISLKYRENN